MNKLLNIIGFVLKKTYTINENKHDEYIIKKFYYDNYVLEISIKNKIYRYSVFEEMNSDNDYMCLFYTILEEETILYLKNKFKHQIRKYKIDKLFI